MAVVRNNALVNGLSGTIGRLVFRQYGGKTILSGKAGSPRRQSAQQKENRNKFRDASQYAKASMLNAEKKAYYWRKAKKMQLPNAYTAAISDYMRKAEIKEIDTRQYKGQAGNVIAIKTYKKDFGVREVKVTLKYADGRIIETAYATKMDQYVFVFKATQPVEGAASVYITVEVCDFHRNKVVSERVITL